MNFKSIRSNIIIAFLAQGTALLLSIITSLLVPKLLGVDQFGYWQLFLFYSSYVGFFHFGLNDGVYLINGGTKRSEINKSLIKSEFIAGLLAQCMIAIGIILVSLFLIDNEDRQFVVYATAFMLLLGNTTSFLSYLYQAMNETKYSSYSLIVAKVFFLLPLVALIIIGVREYQLYVVSYVASQAISLLYSLYVGKDILVSKIKDIETTISACSLSIRVGIKLMMSNIASMLILGIARAVIDAVWGVDTFGELSLSLSLVNFFLLFISQVSMVLFPALRQINSNELRKVFHSLRNGLSIIMPIVFLMCVPIKNAISFWLPQYGDSLYMFVLLLPICVYDAMMSLIYTTLFKVLREENTLLHINIAAVVFSATGAIVFGFIFQTISGIVLSMVAAVVLRVIISDKILSSKISTKHSRLLYCDLALTVIFIVTSLYTSELMAEIVYFFSYAMFLFICKKNVKKLTDDVVSIRKRRDE